MTIISAVFVPEGIAMAADSRLTNTINKERNVEYFTLTDNAQKLLTVRGETVGISFCGNAFLDGKTVADFIRLFDIKQINSTDTVRDIAEKLHVHLKSYTDDISSFYIAGYDYDRPCAYAVSREICENLNEDPEGELLYGSVWNGDIERITPFIQSIRANYELMPLKDAVDYAEFIVELNIKEQRFNDGISTCGGPIDLLVITKDYTKFLKHKILKP
ncbi:hypothetical protein RGU74_21315 [Bacillus cereus]|uniref:hypothetical protein n=1 Tax=Bacillus cereus TaxID=1396 RepID=UPI0028532055|nr:hypothetical protein [Bacillus cereus]MDR4986155.1 hypothetical protein [Bacillus cereus]